MTRHTNPFYTIDEAVDVLRNLGAKPMAHIIHPTEENFNWQDRILSVSAGRVYDEQYNYHFDVTIHIDREGFDALVAMTGLVISVEEFDDDYLAEVVYPGSLLKVFTLVPKEAN